MKIQSVGNINFKSKKLYKATLEKPACLPKDINSDVYISELTPNDKMRMLKSFNRWINTTFGDMVINSFLKECERPDSKIGKDMRYFIVEDAKNRQIKGMCLVGDVKDNFWISFLQTEREMNREKTLKGIGTCLMYALMEQAQKLHKNSMTLRANSKSYDFYHNVGFIQPFTLQNDFVLHSSKFENESKKIKERYSIANL